MNKVLNHRPNDYYYDPIYTVSSEKDYYKAALNAKLSSAKFALCPIFPTMFSDLPHQPRHVMVMRQSSSTPKFKPSCPEVSATNLADVGGADRHRYFARPIHSPRKASEVHYPLVMHLSPKISRKKCNKIVQTQYRESSAQTDPWEPEYSVMDDGDPELLMLDFLKWGSGLPCGILEARLIERARMKRAWEKALPPVTDPESLDKRKLILEAIARDEWAAREQEINETNELRIQLLVEMINEVHRKAKIRAEEKMKSFCKTKLAEKEQKLQSLRHKAKRDMRKLEMTQRSYRPVDIIEEHVNRKSELYAPLMRHGQHPKRWHQVIDDHVKLHRAQFLGAVDLCTTPRCLKDATKISHLDLKLPGTQLCIRETKWTAPVLKQLHEELKNLRAKERRPCTLRVRVKGRTSEVATPHVEPGDEYEEDMHQASILIESFLSGRASQVLIYEGRDRCRQLIHELRSTHALQIDEKERIFYKRLEVKSQQREYALCTNNAAAIADSLKKLSGNVVGTLLDFLNKELRRLIDERKIHAMCLLFERERHAREAAEAGRRQEELRRQREHDEMFKQVVKINQETIDLYLEDIITEGMNFSSEVEASRYVKKLAKEIDDGCYATQNTETYIEKEELVANLVHNFLLPDVEKHIIREKIKKKQKVYLKTAHDSIYDLYENLPKAEPKLTKSEKRDMRTKKEVLEKAVGINTIHAVSTTDTQVHTNLSSESHVNIIFSATKAGFKDFEILSNIHPAMETLADKEDAVSTITSGSTVIPLRYAETNLDIKTLEMPLGVSNEILFVNLNPKNNKQ